MDPVDVVRRFNAAISGQDLADLASLMSDDHAFVDTDGSTVRGKQACLDAWRGFFTTVGDCHNVFTELTVHDDIVTVSGHSVCSRPELAGPALWTARVRGALVDEWRVYEDTPHVRHELGLPQQVQ